MRSKNYGINVRVTEQEKQKLETNKGLLVKLDARIAEMEALR